MVAVDQALQCFVGAWGLLNATGINTTTGAIVPDWHDQYPGGITLYTASGYQNFIITANDTTQADVRPRELVQGANPAGSDARWALVGKYSLAVGGAFELSNVTARPCGGAGGSGPSGTKLNYFTTATLPMWEGLNTTQQFEFFDDCSVHVLRLQVASDLEGIVYFNRLPPFKS